MFLILSESLVPGDAISSAFSTLGDSDDAALLARLGVAPETIRAMEPLTGGISGVSVARLLLSRPVVPGATPYGARRIYKRVEPEGGWLGVASRDTGPRELRLHASGLLADLPASLATGVLAYAEPVSTLAPAGGLLLADERGHLLPNPRLAPPGRLPPVITAILRGLAELHARYWNDPRLADPALGLIATRNGLLLTAPATVAERIGAGDRNPYLPLARSGWETFFQLAAPRDAAHLLGILADPAPAVAAIDALPHTLVHGDVWGPNLGWLPATRRAPRRGRRLLLLDWALATAGPCTYDPLWLCGTWHALDPARVLAAYRAALSRALAARGKPLPAATWRLLAAAGYLRTALTCGEALGRAASEAPPGAARTRAEERARWWAHHATLAADRLLVLPPVGV